ncbi:MAG: hypothetical protein PHP25_04550 [Candidatus Moranbacteria bacterium]|nr:hypothetical protein [Candidatus Moranbacteria bacterium]
MDMRKTAGKRTQTFRNINSQFSIWLGKRIVIKGYAIPYKSMLMAFLVFLALVGVFYFATFQFLKNQNDPNVASQKEIKAITGRIGKFMELPQEETPTLATVSDQEKLKGQQFFLNAKNGDKVLVYPKAKKAILYRPSSGKIIEVANLTSGVRSEPPAGDQPPNIPGN